MTSRRAIGISHVRAEERPVKRGNNGAQETLLRYIIRACRIGEESSATHHVVRT